MEKNKKFNKNIKYLLIIFAMIIFHFSLYLVSKFFVSNPQVLNNDFEDKIPLFPVFIIFYFSWYIALIAVPFFLAKKDKENFKIYCVSFITCAIITFPIFIFFPTALKVPEIQNNDIFSLLCNFIYEHDIDEVSSISVGFPVTINCFPSGHTIISLLFIYSYLFSKNMKYSDKFIVTIISILIIISTIFVKQHVFIDLVGGFILATAVFLSVRFIFRKFS